MKVKVNIENIVDMLNTATLDELSELAFKVKERVQDITAVGELNADEKQSVRNGMMIPAIRDIRIRTGAGLIQAKRAADAYRAEYLK